MVQYESRGFRIHIGRLKKPPEIYECFDLTEFYRIKKVSF